MKHWKAPGLSIAVVKDFKVEWARGYGVKDIDTKEPVTTETLFQAGSISKPVAAMVALKRVQAGKISELAIANYKKSLELNPKNTHGAEMLKKLEKND